MLAFSGLGFGLPLGLNSVEGTEAALLVAAAATRSTWRRAMVAALAGVATLVPIGAGLFFAFRYLPGQYIDYAIAVLIFSLGVREVIEGVRGRRAGEGGGEEHPDGGDAQASASAEPRRQQNDSADRREGSAGSWTAVWPGYVGMVLEGGEALLYAFGVAHGSASYVSAGIGGVVGFALPWVGLAPLRRVIDRLPEWKVELGIGLILMTAATIFGVLRTTGVFGG